MTYGLLDGLATLLPTLPAEEYLQIGERVPLAQDAVVCIDCDVICLFSLATSDSKCVIPVVNIKFYDVYDFIGTKITKSV